jgi:hypothetical protein
MVFWPSSPANGMLTPPTHGISNPLYGIMNPSILVEMTGFNLPWGGSKYNDEKATPGSIYHLFWPPSHGILTSLPMVYWPPTFNIPWVGGQYTMGRVPMVYPTPIHYILIPLSVVFLTPLPMVFWPSSPTNGMLTPPYPWYIKPSLWYYEPLYFGRNDGIQFTMRRFKIQWRKGDPGVNISFEN